MKSSTPCALLRYAVCLLATFLFSSHVQAHSQTVAAPSAGGGRTWYVRSDGGTRYTPSTMISGNEEGNPDGQCDGLADAPYPGSGKNRHCAFREVRDLWSDGAYAHTPGEFPAWGWVIKGGDTVVLRGSVASGKSYRVGWDNPKSAYSDTLKAFRGLPGDPYGSGMPPLPSGTADHPTRLLGENYAACSAQGARTQLHGGYAAGTVLNLSGTHFADVECLDVTDFSGCSRAGSATNHCNSDPGTMSDYATTGLTVSNQTAHLLLNNVRIHGLANSGISGSTGDDVQMTHVDVIGNALAGWNADDGTTGTGKTSMRDFNISWNGCAEEYPIAHPQPYAQCADDNSAGYGDGFGTATLPSKGWQITFDHGTVSYNTQDGLDALHLIGPGSSMTITHVLAFGNMGQQIKVGGQAGTATDNKLVSNCNALRQAIPGTPPGYNAKLSDFCRAADSGVLISVGNGSTTAYRNNTLYSASATGIVVECDNVNGPCGRDARIDFRDNTFVGFKNDQAHGYPGGGTGDLSNPIYMAEDFGHDPFTNAGSQYSGNITFHAKENWHCPAVGEQHAHCTDPHLKDQTWHNYGYGDMEPTAAAAAVARETGSSGPSESLTTNLTPSPNLLRRHPARYLAAGATVVAAYTGLRLMPFSPVARKRKRPNDT